LPHLYLKQLKNKKGANMNRGWLSFELNPRMAATLQRLDKWFYADLQQSNADICIQLMALDILNLSSGKALAKPERNIYGK
jgi:hypothetical protein